MAKRNWIVQYIFAGRSEPMTKTEAMHAVDAHHEALYAEKIRGWWKRKVWPT